MARGGFLYIDYEVGETAGGLKLAANSSYEAAERDVRTHLHLGDDWLVRFVQYRRDKAYTVPSSAWSWEPEQDVDLQLVVVKRPQQPGAKEETNTPSVGRSTTPAYSPHPPAVPAPPGKLPREPAGLTPPQSPPPTTSSAPTIEDDAVVPATPTNSDDSSDDQGDLGAGGKGLSSQESTSARETKGKRTQSRTLSREQLAREADGERLISPHQARPSQAAFGSLPTASSSLPTASSSGISPRSFAKSSSKNDSRISDAPSPASAFAHASSASSAPQSSQDAHPLPSPHQQALNSSLNSSQGSNLSSVSATCSELAGRGRHEAPSPFRGKIDCTENERRQAIKWGKRKEVDPPAPAVSPAPAHRTSPRRSSVGSDFQIGLVGNEIAFVARSPAVRPPKSSQMEAQVGQGSSQSEEQGAQDVEMEGPLSFESEESSIVIKKERHSSPLLFRQPTTSGASGSGSDASRNRALKHHSSASASGESTSIDPPPTRDVQARQAILQSLQAPPRPSTASSRGTKRKETSTPQHSPHREATRSPNKRPRLTDSAPAATASTAARPLARGPSREERESPRQRAALAKKANALASTSQPHLSTPLTTKNASAKSKPATKPRQSLPAILPSASASISTPSASQLVARPSLPPPPSGSRRSSRWHYKLRLPASPLSPYQAAQHKPTFVFTRGAVNGATEGLTLQFLFEAAERVTGWKRKNLRIRCRCGEAEGGEAVSQETASARSASEGASLGSSQSEGGVVERRAWGSDHMYIGFRDLEEWGLKCGDVVEVDYALLIR